MTKPKAINREKLVAFVLSIIAKGVDLMPNEKLEKLKHEQYVAERKLTAAKHKEKRLESEIKRLTRSERTHRLYKGAHKTVILKITIMASVRRDWQRNNGYLVRAGYPLFFCRHEKQ